MWTSVSPWVLAQLPAEIDMHALIAEHLLMNREVWSYLSALN